MNWIVPRLCRAGLDAPNEGACSSVTDLDIYCLSGCEAAFQEIVLEVGKLEVSIRPEA